jgi:hypothetical protein
LQRYNKKPPDVSDQRAPRIFRLPGISANFYAPNSVSLDYLLHFVQGNTNTLGAGRQILLPFFKVLQGVNTIPSLHVHPLVLVKVAIGYCFKDE